MKTQQGTTFRQHLRESKNIVTTWPSWKKESSPSKTLSSHPNPSERNIYSSQTVRG